MIRVWSEPTLKLKLETLHITSSTIAPLAIFDDFYKNREVGGVVDSIHRSTRAAPIEIPTFQMLRDVISEVLSALIDTFLLIQGHFIWKMKF